MGEWFAGVVDDLATEAVRGLRVDMVPLVAGPPPSLARTWVAEFDAAYPAAVSRMVDEHLSRIRRREANTAMALWGIHL